MRLEFSLKSMNVVSKNKGIEGKIFILLWEFALLSLTPQMKRRDNQLPPRRLLKRLPMLQK